MLLDKTESPIIALDAIFVIAFWVVIFGKVVPLALVILLLAPAPGAMFRRLDSCDWAFNLISSRVDWALGDTSDISCSEENR